MSDSRANVKIENDTPRDEIQEMLNRANDLPGVADVLRVYANLDPAVATFLVYSMAQSAPSTSSASATLA